jgi:AcrR family transcriptional regulator
VILPAEPAPAAGPLLPTHVQIDGTRRRVLEAALLLFAARGYHGVSMRDLAAEAGVGASSLYAHVASKEELLRDLIVVGHEEHRDRIRRAVLESTGAPADQLRAITRAHVAMHAELPMLATVCNNELHALSESSKREVYAVRGGAEEMILDIIERGRRLGVFDCPDAWLAVAAIGAMGIRVAAWFRPGGDHTVEDVCERYADFALRIVGSKLGGKDSNLE